MPAGQPPNLHSLYMRGMHPPSVECEPDHPRPLKHSRAMRSEDGVNIRASLNEKAASLGTGGLSCARGPGLGKAPRGWVPNLYWDASAAPNVSSYRRYRRCIANEKVPPPRG